MTGVAAAAVDAAVGVCDNAALMVAIAAAVSALPARELDADRDNTSAGTGGGCFETVLLRGFVAASIATLLSIVVVCTVFASDADGIVDDDVDDDGDDDDDEVLTLMR